MPDWLQDIYNVVKLRPKSACGNVSAGPEGDRRSLGAGPGVNARLPSYKLCYLQMFI